MPCPVISLDPAFTHAQQGHLAAAFTGPICPPSGPVTMPPLRVLLRTLCIPPPPFVILSLKQCRHISRSASPPRRLQLFLRPVSIQFFRQLMPILISPGELPLTLLINLLNLIPLGAILPASILLPRIRRGIRFHRCSFLHKRADSFVTDYFAIFPVNCHEKEVTAVLTFF